jgi:quercetin dioxygenase-like cupin family protein
MKIINYPSLYNEPVAKRMLLEFDRGIVMNLQLKQGEKIPRHLAPCEAIIIVNEGKVYFRSGIHEEVLAPGILGKFEVEDDHEFEAIENSSIVIVKVNGNK